MTAPGARLFALAALVSAAACRGDARHAETAIARYTTAREGARTPVTVALVDSIPWENDLTSGTLHRVAVSSRGRTDTIVDVRTSQLPAVLDDTVVVGLRYAEETVQGAFEYVPASRALRTVALPSDLYDLSTPRFAPDGRHLAYLGRDSTHRGYAVVVAWPSVGVVYRGPAVPLLATDAGVDELAWNDARRFTLVIHLDQPLRARQRTRGTIGADGRATVVVDTLPPPEPKPE